MHKLRIIIIIIIIKLLTQLELHVLPNGRKISIELYGVTSQNTWYPQDNRKSYNLNIIRTIFQYPAALKCHL
jgi:hypothetical protein